MLARPAEISIDKNSAFSPLRENHSDICYCSTFAFIRPGAGCDESLQWLIDARKHQIGA